MNILLDDFFIGRLSRMPSETLVLINKRIIKNVFVENYTTEPVDLTKADVPPLYTRLKINTLTTLWTIEIPDDPAEKDKQNNDILGILTENTKAVLQMVEASDKPETPTLLICEKEDGSNTPIMSVKPDTILNMQFSKKSPVVNLGNLIDTTSEKEQTCVMNLTISFGDTRPFLYLDFVVNEGQSHDLLGLLHQLLSMTPSVIKFEDKINKTVVEKKTLHLCCDKVRELTQGVPG